MNSGYCPPVHWYPLVLEHGVSGCVGELGILCGGANVPDMGCRTSYVGQICG